jgi:hypothetical protein
MSDTMRNLEDLIAEEVGIGVHTGLRKYCGSIEANKAWHSIKEMPSKEWECVCDGVAEEIIKVLQEQYVKGNLIGKLWPPLCVL